MDLNWKQQHVYDELKRHCLINQGKILIVASQTAYRMYEKVLMLEAFNEKLETFRPEDITRSRNYAPFSLGVLIAAGSDEAREIYKELDPIKDESLPVVFCLPERKLVSPKTNWQYSGIQYGGMFYLASQYARTIKPRGGAYCEFGVYDGRSFVMAAQYLKDVCGTFHAFDSYRGIKGSLEEESGHYKDGDFRANVETFEYNIKFAGVEDLPYIVHPGFFQKTLKGRNSQKDGVGPISIVHIDVDVFEPAKLALDYVTPGLSDGALLLFDDYDQISARNDMGERRAVAEWLSENDNLEIELYRTYGVFCRSFILHRRI